MKKALVLFSGTGSVNNVLHTMGYDVISVDIDPKWNATYTMDVRHFVCSNLYPSGYFDLIWSSPPCTEYSRAKTLGIRDIQGSNAVVKSALQYMSYMRPKHWFMENPVGLLMKQPFMEKYWNQYLHITSYCMYGKLYKKPTCIWTNKILDKPLKYCDSTSSCTIKRKLGVHVMTAQQYDPVQIGVGRDISYQIPAKLLETLFKLQR